MKDFLDKVAVVTGGASGIGLGIARALAREGTNVVIADLDKGAAERAADELRGTGVRSLAVATDVRRTESVGTLAAAVKQEMGGVDLVFNNAGVYLGGPMRRATEDDWRFVLDVNLDGVFRVGQTFTKMLIDQGRGGYIVNTASVGGFLSYGAGVAYTVSKYGVVAYSEALRVDLEPEGIGVSTLCPGPIDTNLPASDRIRAAEERAGGFSEALSPLTRGGMKPDQVGPIVLAGIRSELPYIFTHDDLREDFSKRFETVLACFDRIAGAASVGVLLLGLLGLFALPDAARAITVGQIDDFETATTQGWVMALFGATPAIPPAVLANTGPDGNGDFALLVTSTGSFGAGGKPVVNNVDSRWLGNYTLAGVTGILLDVRNPSAVDLTLRVGIDGPSVGTTGGRWVTGGVLVPAQSGWMTFSFSLRSQDLLPGDFAATSAATTRANVAVLRVMHAPDADWTSAVITAQLLLDNIEAVPEPAAGTSVLAGILLVRALAARRVSGRRHP